MQVLCFEDGFLKLRRAVDETHLLDGETAPRLLVYVPLDRGDAHDALDVLVKTSHLFQPLPQAMQDMALIDRFHFYLPGWEVPKMATEHFTNGYGFVVDYLAEAVRELRKHNFTEVIDRHFSLGSHLNARDAKAVRKTLSGLVKLLHPDRQVSTEELREYLELAIEGRRRVKEQLKKMGSFEYYQTSFSYLVNESMEEHFVGVPETHPRGHAPGSHPPRAYPPPRVWYSQCTNS